MERARCFPLFASVNKFYLDLMASTPGWIIHDEDEADHQAEALTP